jgi:glutamate dehydrogenase/leucine dehydrogenase
VRTRRRARRRNGARTSLQGRRGRGHQLAADAIAVQLAERGITWAPDFVANAGGIINISVELEGNGYDAERAEALVRRVGDTTREIFDHADASDTTPLAAAMEIARRRLAEAAAPAVQR